MTSTDGAIIRVDMGAGGWAAIPRSSMGNQRLSLRARGLLSWFLTRTDGFEIRVEACRKINKLGRHAWSSIATELAREGHYHRRTVNGEGGQIRTVVSITALPVPGFTDARFPDTGTDVGFSDSRLNRQSAQPVAGEPDIKQQTRHKRYKTTTTTPPPPPPPPPPPAAGGGGSALFFKMGEVPAALLKVLEGSGATATMWQSLLDELAGAQDAGVQAGKPMRSPAGYLRRLALIEASEGLVYEHAERVAQDRRDRTAAERRAANQAAAQATTPPGSTSKVQSKNQKQLPSAARLAAKEAAAEIKKRAAEEKLAKSRES